MNHARAIVTATAAVTLVAAPVAGLAGHAAAAGSRTVPGTAPLSVSGAVDHGVAPAATRSITLVLNQRNAAALQQRLAGHAAPLTTAQWMATYAPAQAEVDTVRSWASGHSLSVAAVPANRAYVRVSGSQAAMQQALGVAYHSFTASGTSYVATVGTATLPASVASVTTSVLGLSSAGHVATTLRRPSSAAAAASGISYPTSYGPKDIANLYGAGSSASGSGQQVSVIAEGDLSQPKQDLVTFENTFGLPQVTWNQVQVGAASTDTSGDDEWDLDTQYSTGLAPNVSQVNVYDGASLSNDDILATIDKWVTDDSTKQASFSAGECDALAYVTGFTSGLDTVLAQAVAQGQTLFTSSGDNGAYCMAVVGENGVPVGVPDTLYPASSPNAIGVGGTTVLGSGPTEISWYAGGGGISPVETVPAWQATAGGSFVDVRRGVPDVSLDADPESGYKVIVDGSQETIGGTSASAPSWQGIWTRAQSAHSGGLGYAGPVLYGLPSSDFNDITIGTNGLYPATPGYDYTTGRGTPKIAALVAGA